MVLRRDRRARAPPPRRRQSEVHGGATGAQPARKAPPPRRRQSDVHSGATGAATGAQSAATATATVRGAWRRHWRRNRRAKLRHRDGDSQRCMAAPLAPQPARKAPPPRRRQSDVHSGATGAATGAQSAATATATVRGAWRRHWRRNRRAKRRHRDGDSQRCMAAPLAPQLARRAPPPQWRSPEAHDSGAPQPGSGIAACDVQSSGSMLTAHTMSSVKSAAHALGSRPAAGKRRWGPSAPLRSLGHVHAMATR